MTLSLCRVLGSLSIFPRVSWKQLLKHHGLLLGTGVQFVVSCTTIEAQIVFKTLLALVTGQLAIAGQLGREVHPQSIRLLLGSRRQRWLGGRVLGRQSCQRWICLALGGHDRTEDGSFFLLPEVRLEGLFLCLPCTVVFAVSFLVVVIDSHCYSIHILEQGGFFLFLGRDRILDLIGEPLVIAMAQNTISLT